MIGVLGSPLKSGSGRDDSDGDPWAATVERALRAGAGIAGIRGFVEERQDLVIETVDGEIVQSTRTHTCGVALDGAAAELRQAYRAHGLPGESVPDDPAVLAPPIDPQDLRVGGARLAARQVALSQRVRIFRPGRPAIEDLRLGRRLRLDARVERRGRVGHASLELASLPTGAAGRDLLRSMLARVAARAEQRLDSRPATRGARAAVFAPGVAGVLVHELVGHALEADTVLAGQSWLAEFEEPRNRTLTVVDDPRRGRAAWTFDDEGSRACATPLWHKGRVTGWLHDASSAARRRVRPTGHGRRASFREAVKPRMGCTFVAAGRMHPGAILEEVDEGLFIRRLESATTDTLRGRALFRVTDADRLRAGRIEEPLQPFVLFVEGRDVLREAKRIGDDLAFDTCIGSCHRDGQALAVSVGAPTICTGLATVIL